MEHVHMKIGFDCPFCGENFRGHDKRRDHINEVHKGLPKEEKGPFICEECGKEYQSGQVTNTIVFSYFFYQIWIKSNDGLVSVSWVSLTKLINRMKYSLSMEDLPFWQSVVRL